MRLDIYLKENNLANSRSKAQEMILNGLILINNRIELSSNYKVKDSDKIIANPGNKRIFVSRAGNKLEQALEEFDVKTRDKTCLDIGSSTGGFTEVLILNKCNRVISVDVGTGQFDNNLLKANNNIHLFEKTDIRDLADNEDFHKLNIKTFDIIVCDVSFISIEKIINNIINFSNENTDIILLLKPQFEVGRQYIKKGIVRDEELYLELINKYKSIFQNNNLRLVDYKLSKTIGSDGNKEFLLYVKWHKNRL